MIAVKPLPPAVLAEIVWLAPGHGQKSGDTADRSRNEHGAHNNLGYVDGGITGRIFALAYNGHLVALLAVSKVNIHAYRERKHQNNVKGIILAPIPPETSRSWFLR